MHRAKSVKKITIARSHTHNKGDSPESVFDLSSHAVAWLSPRKALPAAGALQRPHQRSWRRNAWRQSCSGVVGTFWRKIVGTLMTWRAGVHVKAMPRNPPPGREGSSSLKTTYTAERKRARAVTRHVQCAAVCCGGGGKRGFRFGNAFFVGKWPNFQTQSSPFPDFRSLS